MTHITIRVPDELKEEMESHPEINWSVVARDAFREKLTRLRVADEITAESTLTEDDVAELSEMVKENLSRRYENE